MKLLALGLIFYTNLSIFLKLGVDKAPEHMIYYTRNHIIPSTVGEADKEDDDKQRTRKAPRCTPI